MIQLSKKCQEPYLALALLALYLWIPHQSLHAADNPDEINISQCMIEITAHEIAKTTQNCYQRKTNSGTILNWFTAKNRQYLVFVSLNKAGPQLMFPYAGGTEHSTTYYLSHFGYIKENWTAIAPAELHSVQTDDGLDVRLYNIDLEDEKGCIGFTTGIGDEHISVHTSVGHQTVASALICPKKPSTRQKLISLLTKIRFH